VDVRQKNKEQEYEKYVQKKMPKSNLGKDCIMAFVVGGIICTIGQVIGNIGKNYYGLDKEATAAFTAIVLVFLGATLTGLGVYDDIGKRAGAGSVVPITGFANSIVAPAMEFKREGYVMGVGAKLFSLAGPVLVYGISSSIIVGILYFLFRKG
jgi:stage V sporulation protein AC